MVSYLYSHENIENYQMIFSMVNHKNLRGYIPFPPCRLVQDEEPNKIKGRIVMKNSLMDSSPEVQAEINYQKEAIFSLYTYAYLVSAGLLINNQYQYVDLNVPVYSELYVTQKFYADHIGGGNKKQSQEIANDTAKRRTGISVSTTIRATSLPGIAQEVQESQDFYKVAEERTKATLEQSGKYLQSLFFKTVGTYPLEIRQKEADFNTNSSFFYSVVKKRDIYYMHHYVTHEKKEDWGASTIAENGNRKFYFLPKCT